MVGNNGEENTPRPHAVRRFPWFGLIVLLGLATLGIWLLKPYSPRARYALNTCFDANPGLRERARVRLLGVEVGYVSGIRPQPLRGDCRLRVEMVITDQTDLAVPKDSVASIETEGVLGPAYVDLDTRNASAAPVEDGTTLPSREPPKLDFDSLLKGSLCKCGERVENNVSDNERTKNDRQPAKQPSGKHQTAK